jgi:hypothetical protein
MRREKAECSGQKAEGSIIDCSRDKGCIYCRERMTVTFSHRTRILQSTSASACLGRGPILLLIGYFSFVLTSVAQQPQSATITGTVLDDSTSALLSNVNIYIANSTLGGNTDERGVFEIRNIPLGTYDLVASRIGYSYFTIRVSFTEARTRNVTIRLKPVNIQMGEVIVSASDPTEWRRQLGKFNDLFIGTTRNSKECKIRNPEVLDFKTDSLNVFEASARQPIQIDNLALGYHIEFNLKAFKVVKDIMTYEGMPKFSEMKPSSPDDEKDWKENRMRAFRGSLRHFLICLFKKTLDRNRYSVFHLDFLELNEGSSNRRRLTEKELIYDSSTPSQKTLRLSGFLEVEFWGDVEKGYNLLRKAGSDGQVSWVELNYYSVGITDRGTINEAFPTKVFGYWSWKRVGDMLPLDYEPEKSD